MTVKLFYLNHVDTIHLLVLDVTMLRIYVVDKKPTNYKYIMPFDQK